jgi:hypothetical protein
MKFLKQILIVVIFTSTVVVKAQYFDITPNYSSATYFPYYNIWDVDITLDIPVEHYYFVQAELRDDQEKLLMVSRTQAFVLSANKSPYNVLYNKNENGNYEYEWIDPSFYQQVQQTGGFLPPGNYEIIYHLLSTTKGCNWAGEMQYIKTVYLTVNLFNLLDLVSPADKDTLLTNYPTLVWLPLSPEVTGNVTYQLKIVQVNEGQIPEESIINNLPYYEEQALTNTSQIYPITARMLESGKQYAWMVTAYVNGNVAAYSSVYSFFLSTAENTQPEPDIDPFYIELVPQAAPQFIEVNEDFIYISYKLIENQSGNLNYSIVNNENGKELVNEEVQPLIVGQGKNLYQIDISRLPDKKQYELSIKGVDNTDVRRLYFYLKKE